MSNIQEIKIKVPEGKSAIYDEATQTIKFVDAERVRSKSWEEFCQNHKITSNEYYINTDSLLSETHRYSVERRFLTDKNLLETKEDAQGILALIQLKRLHDEWVGDWRPFYYPVKFYINERIKPQAQEKYSIVYYDEKLIVDVTYNNQRFLTFPTKEMATEFLSCFKDLIETAKMFI